MRILVLNGPNLNLLGSRDPDTYGSMTLEELDEAVTRWGEDLGQDVETLQSNRESDLVEAIHRDDIDGIVLNPAVFTHTSRAIAEAVSSISAPVVEVHISNVKKREPWRATSLVAPHCVYTIYGRGVVGYRHALRHLANRAAVPTARVSYGDDNDQVGDLRHGDSTLAVLIHGGFWLDEWTRDTMESIALDLTRSGATTWNIEYRRLPRGGWPGSFDDVLEALNRIPSLGKAWRRVVVVGHSAGGHMGIWAAPRASATIDRIVALAPITNLERHARSGRFAAGSAQSLLDQGAPRSLDARDVPTYLVHGTRDRHVPVDDSLDLASANGLDLLTPEAGHFDLLDPGREHWVQIREAVLA